ncbi:hypothetical protein KQX54_000342, partial [Cotesia glomerata]
VQIMQDFVLSFNDFSEALNATTNCRRAKKIMRTMWSKEDKKKMLVKYDPKKPDSTVVQETDYVKILKIMTALDEYKVIPVFKDNDRAIINIKTWVSEWLKQS